MPRTDLVIARAGRNSLHRNWLGVEAERQWDLFLCPYQTLDPLAGEQCRVGEVIPGPKWTGLRELLGKWNGWREYRRIWLPDDDLFCTQPVINEMFEIAERLSLALCAPALHEASFYAHFSTMRNLRCSARFTGFVEIMAPCFTAATLDKLLPTLDLTTTGWGWGLDSVWPKLLDYRQVGVIDATPVLHTRPVGAFRDADLGARVHAESDRLLQEYRCSQVHTTFAAIDADLAPIDCSAEALTATLVDGWRYLLHDNPAVLPWVVEAQRPPEGWMPYPTAGSPNGGVGHR